MAFYNPQLPHVANSLPVRIAIPVCTSSCVHCAAHKALTLPNTLHLEHKLQPRLVWAHKRNQQSLL
jgi:hypothetical protein